MARKNKDDTPDPLHGGAIHVPRSRGAVSGTLLIALGAWGALIPFIGPWFNFSYTPEQSWHWTAARWWLEVLPGIAVFVGGLVLLLSANRITASIGGWVAVAGGVWFVLGTTFESLFHLGSPGTPAGSSHTLRVIESLALFSGLGALIIILATLALGRLSVRSVRDVRSAQRREVEQELELRRRADYARAREAEVAAGGSGPHDADGHGEGGSTPTRARRHDDRRQVAPARARRRPATFATPHRPAGGDKYRNHRPGRYARPLPVAAERPAVARVRRRHRARSRQQLNPKRAKCRLAPRSPKFFASPVTSGTVNLRLSRDLRDTGS